MRSREELDDLNQKKEAIRKRLEIICKNSHTNLSDEIIGLEMQDELTAKVTLSDNIHFILYKDIIDDTFIINTYKKGVNISGDRIMLDAIIDDLDVAIKIVEDIICDKALKSRNLELDGIIAEIFLKIL